MAAAADDRETVKIEMPSYAPWALSDRRLALLWPNVDLCSVFSETFVWVGYVTAVSRAIRGGAWHADFHCSIYRSSANALETIALPHSAVQPCLMPVAPGSKEIPQLLALRITRGVNVPFPEMRMYGRGVQLPNEAINEALAGQSDEDALIGTQVLVAPPLMLPEARLVAGCKMVGHVAAARVEGSTLLLFFRATVPVDGENTYLALARHPCAAVAASKVPSRAFVFWLETA
jgi:hypothetical protein